MKWLVSLLCFILSFGTLCIQNQAEAKTPFNFLENIEADETENDLFFRLHFNRDISSSIQPVFYKKSIQFDIHGTGIKGKKTIPVRNDMLKELKVYAYKPGVIRVRLILAKEGLNLKKGLHISKSGNTLVIDINREDAGLALPKHSGIKNETDRKILLALAEASDGFVKENKVLDSSKHTITLTKKSFLDKKGQAETSRESIPKGNVDEFEVSPQDNLSHVKENIISVFPSLMKMGGALAIILAMIFLASGGAKKILSGNKMFQNKNKLIQVLGSGAIGLKKSILLVDVAGEILVLGVTNDNITMLTKLEEQESIKQARGYVKGDTSETLVSSLKKMLSKNGSQANDFSNELEESRKREPHANKDELIEDLAKNIRDRAENLKMKA